MNRSTRFFLIALAIAFSVLGCGGSGSNEVIPPANNSGGGGDGGTGDSTSSLVIEELADGFCHVDGMVRETQSQGNTGPGYAAPDNDQTNGIDYVIEASSAGSYPLVFRYTASSDSTGSVAINEAAVYPLTFPASGNNSTWLEATVEVDLETGTNRINLGTSSSSGLPDIDSLTISGTGLSALPCSFEYVEQNASACAALSPADDGALDSEALYGYAGVAGRGLNTTTGGADASPIQVSSYGELAEAVKGDTPKTLQIYGNLIRPQDAGSMLDLGSNTTIQGVSGATLQGFGLKIDGEANVIISDLTFTDYADDGITIEDSAHHIWVHHNLFTAGQDGALDIRRDSSFITVAWNKFSGTDKTALIGSSDEEFESGGGNTQVTYHHNWFHQTVQRNPRIRFAQVHVANNYYDGVTGYGAVSVQFADLLSQANYFDLPSGRVALSTGTVATSPHKGDLVSCDDWTGEAVIQTRGSAFDPGLDYGLPLVDSQQVPAWVTGNAGPRP